MIIDQLLQLVGANSLVQAWYKWGVFAGLLVIGLAAFWIFYDSTRVMREAILWKALSVVAVILLLPSLAFRLAPSLAYPNLLGAVVPMAYLGLAAAIIALLSVSLYAAGVGEPANRCPRCGRTLDPSWDRCPYCEPEVVSPPPPPQVGPTEAVEPQPVEPPPIVPTPMTEILIGPPSELAWLVVTSGPRTGKEFRLGEVTGIGRDPTQNEVVIDDQAMSRQHAKIKLEGKKFVIHDLASSNGTFVNDGQVYRQVLSDGDRIRMGETEFTFIEVHEKGEGGKPATGKSKKRQKA